MSDAAMIVPELPQADGPSGAGFTVQDILDIAVLGSLVDPDELIQRLSDARLAALSRGARTLVVVTETEILRRAGASEPTSDAPGGPAGEPPTGE